MTPDPNITRSASPNRNNASTHTLQSLDAGLAAAFATDQTPGGWTQPPLLRDDPSGYSPVVQPSSPEMPRKSPDRYQLLGEIARGGMGVILKGRDKDLGRDIAFKVLKAESSNRPGVVQRFIEEAQIGGQLQHPGIIPIYDLGHFADGRPYFAMKLVKGHTMASLMTDQSPTSDRGKMLQIFLQVCQTIAYAHAKGVIHRDLKPSNIMVGAFGEVLVMDWGLAKVLSRGGIADEERANQVLSAPGLIEEPTVINTARSGSGSDTAAGSVMGTPAFMSPEQAGGEIDKLDERADVFGLGAVLCVILTGLPPYIADSSEALRLKAVRGQLADAFARLDASAYDAELVALCKRCLSADRTARPRHAGEVAETMSVYLASVEQRVHTANIERAAAEARTLEEANTRRIAEEKTIEERKRRKVQLALVTSLGLLALGGGTFGWWQDRQTEQHKLAQSEADGRTARSETARIKAEAEASRQQQEEIQRQFRNRDATLTLLNNAKTMFQNGNSERVSALLEQAEKRIAEGGADDLRTQLTNYRGEWVMLQEINRIDNERWTLVDGEYNQQAIAQRLKKAFADYGLIPGTTPAEQAAETINKSLIREPLLTSLEVWFVHDKSNSDLRTILSIADPDEFRNRARKTNYSQAFLAWAFTHKSRSTEKPEWFTAVWFAVGHGQDVTADKTAREQMLLSALAHQPNQFSVLMSLVTLDMSQKIELAHQRLGLARAALALQPRNAVAWNNLGVFLKYSNDFEGAVTAFKNAKMYDPNLARAYSNLGNVLKELGHVSQAIAEHKEAIRLQPNLALAHCNLGSALSLAGDELGSIAASKEAIRLDPNLAMAHSNLAAASVHLGDFQGAIAASKEALRIDPNHVPARIHLCAAQRAMGQLPLALATIKEAVRIDPKDATSHNTLGVILKETGDTPGAIAEYREAIRLDPKYPEPHHNLANAMKETGELKGAITEYKEAIRLNPTFSEPHYSLGNALKDLKDYARAISEYREAIRLNPRYSNAYNNLGIALHESGNVSEAINAYREAIRLDPKYPEPHLGLGNILRESGDFAGAIAEYREAIRLNPKYTKAHSNLGLAFQKSGNLQGAIDAYKEAVRIDPDYFIGYNNLGFALYEARDLKGAIEAWKEALRIDPKNAELHYSLGIILQQSGNLAQAVEEWKEALRINPKFPGAHNNLGMALKEKGDLAGAINEFKEALRLDPKFPISHFNLATIYLAQKEYTEAITSARAAIHSEPRYADAHALLGSALLKMNDISGARDAFAKAALLNPKQFGDLLKELPPIPTAPSPREVNP